MKWKEFKGKRIQDGTHVIVKFKQETLPVNDCFVYDIKNILDGKIEDKYITKQVKLMLETEDISKYIKDYKCKKLLYFYNLESDGEASLYYLPSDVEKSDITHYIEYPEL